MPKLGPRTLFMRKRNFKVGTGNGSRYGFSEQPRHAVDLIYGILLLLIVGVFCA